MLQQVYSQHYLVIQTPSISTQISMNISRSQVLLYKSLSTLGSNYSSKNDLIIITRITVIKRFTHNKKALETGIKTAPKVAEALGVTGISNATNNLTKPNSPPSHPLGPQTSTYVHPQPEPSPVNPDPKPTPPKSVLPLVPMAEKHKDAIENFNSTAKKDETNDANKTPAEAPSSAQPDKPFTPNSNAVTSVVDKAKPVISQDNNAQVTAAIQTSTLSAQDNSQASPLGEPSSNMSQAASEMTTTVFKGISGVSNNNIGLHAAYQANMNHVLQLTTSSAQESSSTTAHITHNTHETSTSQQPHIDITADQSSHTSHPQASSSAASNNNNNATVAQNSTMSYSQPTPNSPAVDSSSINTDPSPTSHAQVSSSTASSSSSHMSHPQPISGISLSSKPESPIPNSPAAGSFTPNKPVPQISNPESNPPALPPTLKPVNSGGGIAFTEQIKALGTTLTNGDDNILPSSIPKSSIITVTNVQGQPIITSITAETTVSDITDADLIEELKKRHLVKENPNATITKIILEDNTTWTIGKAMKKIKFAPLGQAYVESMLSTQSTLPPPKMSCDISLTDFIISAPPQISTETFIEHGEHKHLLIVYNKSDGEYYAIGYLTSKQSAIKLSDEQFNSFQKQELDPTYVSSKAKVQYCVIFESAKKMETDDISRTKADIKYLQNMPENIQDVLKNECQTLLMKSITLFNKIGFTKQDLLDMCKKHDQVTQTPHAKHPLTADQITKNQGNHEQQVQQNKLKTVGTDSNNDKTDVN